MAELSGAVPFFAGASYEELENEEAFFGKPNGAQRGASSAAGGFGRTPRPDRPSADYPFSLLVEYDEYAHRATPIRSEVPGLGRIELAAGVWLRSGDAEALGIEAGAPVRLISRTGRTTARALISERIQPGVVRMVGRGGEGSRAAVLDLLLDPVSKAPEEICAVRIERL